MHGVVERERRLVSEYATRRWPNARIMTEARLFTPSVDSRGVLLTPEEQRLLKQRGRFCDALILERDSWTILEASIQPKADKIGQLVMYELLALADSEYEAYWTKPLHKLALWAFRDPVIEEVCKRFGIEVDYYSPQWVAESLRERYSSSLSKTGHKAYPREIVESK